MESVKLLHSNLIPTQAVLSEIIKRRTPWMTQISHKDWQLRAMVLDYRKTHGWPLELGYMVNIAWYGVFREGVLDCAIGFDENYSKTEGTWLYVTDTVCKTSTEAKRSFSKLMDFIDRVPFLIRGLIYTDNVSLLRVVQRRNWRHTAWFVERAKL